MCFWKAAECTVVCLRGHPLWVGGASVPEQLNRPLFPLSTCPEVRVSLAARQPWANPNPVCSLQEEAFLAPSPLFGGRGVLVCLKGELAPLADATFKQFLCKDSHQSRVMQGRALGKGRMQLPGSQGQHPCAAAGARE